MIMRTHGNNVANPTLFTRMDEVGADLITISSHLGARPKCFKDQGQLFNRKGGSGTVEDANGEQIPYRDWNTSSYGLPDGILGINCRHSAGFFIADKSTFKPEVFDERENANRYKQEQKQRRYEREIRKSKRKRDVAKALGNEDEARNHDRMSRMKSKRLKEHIEEHNLRRSKVRERPLDKPVMSKGSNEKIKSSAVHPSDPKKVRKPDIQKAYDKALKTDDNVFTAPTRQEKDGTINAFGSYVKNVPPIDDYHDIASHGNQHTMEMWGKDVDAKTYANMLRQKGDYPAGSNIRILACDVGIRNEKGECFAQQLANELGVNVKAPNGKLIVYNDGTCDILNSTEKGEYEEFIPKGGNLYEPSVK